MDSCAGSDGVPGPRLRPSGHTEKARQDEWRAFRGDW